MKESINITINPFKSKNLAQARLKAWQRGLAMTHEEIIRQMRENGSTPRPNPLYRGQK
jgi:hypothetical protein